MPRSGLAFSFCGKGTVARPPPQAGMLFLVVGQASVDPLKSWKMIVSAGLGRRRRECRLNSSPTPDFEAGS